MSQVKGFLESMAGLSVAEGRRQGGEGGGAGRCREMASVGVGGREWRVFSVGRRGGSDREGVRRGMLQEVWSLES